MENKLRHLLAIRTVRLHLRIWGIGTLGLFSSVASAQYYCPPTVIVTTWEACAGPGKTNCSIHHSHQYVPSGSCPPPPAPTPPTPPVPPVSYPPPPVVKTAEEIEREQRVRFCKEYPAEINLAVNRCRNSALGYHSYFLATKCSSGGTWSFSVQLTKAINVNFSKDVSASDCRAQAEVSLMYFQDSCRLSGDEYLHVMGQQCSDIP